ncbi:alpha/beta hydrolase family protein [Flavobacterium sharifuzzamanii]|uniref:alpha/beta hydrolase family protein n=1 Tax=Flavobacterium sharifuzzamanii TaxID=2211133 RepID=UPI000DAE8948|nr:alpha/beta hydrolase [Flavobacterium sharifuzzamanii]KAF2079140.1 alpha/beta hydrolase [Flavobacterium sharifuzzamanii]
MKKIILFALLIFSFFNSFAQDISGQWNGVLKLPNNQLKVVFNLTKTENGYTSTTDSPDQNVKGIPVKSTTFENSVLKLDIPAVGGSYEGKLNADTIFVGKITQNGHTLDLNLSKGNIEVAKTQEPKQPFPYYTENVKFENKKDQVTLAGTLSLPKKEGNFPAVILISGSGAQNRDEEMLGHKPFLVLADYLTKKGIAVLRFDDRGFGESTGDFKSATTTDFVKDVQAGVDYLKTRKEINKNKIGLIGHSEGGVIAPIVAGNSKDIAFIVLMAGTGIRGDKLLLLQKELIEREMGVSEEEIKRGQETYKEIYELITSSSSVDEKLKKDVKNIFESKLGVKDKRADAYTYEVTNPWIYNFLKLDPAPYLEKVKCPVLAINGSKDLQVPAEANLQNINKALTKAGNKKVTIKELPNLNHLFQECKTGLPKEYASIEQTISPTALEEISSWVLLQIK